MATHKNDVDTHSNPKECTENGHCCKSQLECGITINVSHKYGG